MRYILIDPVARTVTEHDDPAVRGDSYERMYEIMNCYRIENSDLGVTPRSEILVDGHGQLNKPLRPAWALGECTVLGRAIILGAGRTNFVSCKLPLERVAKAVTWDVPPPVPRPMEVRSFATTDELRAFTATRYRPKWLP